MLARRAFIAGALAALASPAALTQGKPHRIGILLSGDQGLYRAEVDQFKHGMQALGYNDGRDVEYLQRGWQPDGLGSLSTAAKELVDRMVEIIVAHGTAPARTISSVSPSTPVLLAGGFDPVKSGLANSFAKPGRNVTGITQRSDEIIAKHLQLVRDVLPNARKVGLLHPSPGVDRFVDDARDVAQQLNLELFASRFDGYHEMELDSAFSGLRAAKLDALVVVHGAFWGARGVRISELADGLRVLSVFPDDRYLRGGGIISYGTNMGAVFKRAAVFADKILRGTKPGDLPIEIASQFDLVVNLKNARKLGIAMPQSILLRADRVIE